MFLLNFLRWIRGTVTFLITGSFPEKLINACLKSRLPIWGIKRGGEGIIATGYADNYKRLRPLCRECGAKVRIQKKSGAFLARRKLLKRKGMLLGFFLGALILFFSQLFIWRIEVNGCGVIDEQQLRQDLKELGISVGARKNGHDIDYICRAMMLKNDDLAWIAVNIVGTTARIELRERVKTPALIDPDDRIGNVVADVDGQIRYMEIYEGQPLVKVGDTVKKGDIIVSGIMEDQYGKRQLKYARAKVLAQVYERNEVTVPLRQLYWSESGEKHTERRLMALGMQLPLFFTGQQSASSFTETAERLPAPFTVTLLTRTVRSAELCERLLTEKQAKEAAMRQLALFAKADKNEKRKIYSREYEYSCDGEYFTIIEYTLTEKDIAAEKEVLLD